MTQDLGTLLYHYVYDKVVVKIYSLYDFLVEIIEDRITASILKVEPARSTDIYMSTATASLV